MHFTKEVLDLMIIRDDLIDHKEDISKVREDFERFSTHELLTLAAKIVIIAERRNLKEKS